MAVVEVDAATGRSRPAAASSVVDPRRHGEVLAPAVHAALDVARLSPADLAAVVVGVGPGPYTSLRVGVVTAVAFGQALDVPAIGVCSLDGVPGPATPPTPQAPGTQTSTTDVATTWAVVTDARRREVFWAIYENGVRTAGPGVALPAQVADELRARSVGVVVGPGTAAYPAAFEGFTVAGSSAFPDPVLLVHRAVPELLAGKPAGPLAPIYLRRPDAAEPRPRTSVVG